MQLRMTFFRWKKKNERWWGCTKTDATADAEKKRGRVSILLKSSQTITASERNRSYQIDLL